MQRGIISCAFPLFSYVSLELLVSLPVTTRPGSVDVSVSNRVAILDLLET